MRTLTAHEYLENSKLEIEALERGELSAEQREIRAIKQKCAKRVKKALSGQGANMEIITQKDPGNQKMAGCADFDRNKMLIAEETLADDDTGWVNHVFDHEKMHLASGKRAFDVRKDLSEDHKNALKGQLKQQDLSVDGLEGFTEIATGKHRRSGYNAVEVPFAEELELLCKKEKKVSLLQTYKNGNANSTVMNYHVRKTADKLLCDQVVNELKKEHGYILNFRRFASLAKRINQNTPSVSSLTHARQVVSSLFAELN